MSEPRKFNIATALKPARSPITLATTDMDASISAPTYETVRVLEEHIATLRNEILTYQDYQVRLVDKIGQLRGQIYDLQRQVCGRR